VLPKCRIEAFDISRIDHTLSLRPTPESLDTSLSPVNHTAFNLDHSTPLRAFDHLGDQDVLPRSKPWPSAFACWPWLTKGLASGPDIGLQAIGADQDGPTKRTTTHPCHQGSDQGHISVLADFTPKPQAGFDLHGERHPHDTVLFLDPNLIGLNLAKVYRAFHLMLMNGLALLASSHPPIGHGSLIESKSLDNGLYWTTVSQQRDHEDNRFGRVAQAVEHRALGGAEGLSAHLTDETLLFLRMNANVTLAALPSSRAVPIGAKCSRGVHHAPPSFVWN